MHHIAIAINFGTAKKILMAVTPVSNFRTPGISILFCLLLFAAISKKSGAQSSRDELRKYLAVINMPGTSDSVLLDAVKNVSAFYQGINQDSAIYYCNKAINIALKTRSNADLAQCYVLQATNYIWSGDFDIAAMYLRRAESLAAQYHYAPILGETWDMTSYMYQLSEVWDEAWIYAKKYLDLCELEKKNNTKLNPAAAYADFAAVYAGMGDYKKSELYFEKAIHGVSDTSCIYERGTYFIDYAKMLTVIDSFQRAKYFLDSALIIFNLFEEPIQVADVYEKYGQMFFQQSLFDSASYYFHGAYEVYKQNDLVIDQERMNISLAKIYIKSNRPDSAYNLIKEAYNFFKSRKELAYRLETIQLLHEAEKGNNILSVNNRYMDEYLTVSRMMKARNNELKTRELMTQFDLEQKEKENLRLKSQNELQKDKLVLLIVFGFIILIVGVLLYILYQQKRSALAQVQKLQKFTQDKNSELGRLVAVKDKLISMIAHDIRAPLASLQNTISLTHDNILDKSEFDHLTRILLGETNHLRGMLDNMLLWARQQIVDIQVSKTNFRITDVLTNIFELYQSNISQKKLIIHNNIPGDTMVFSDQDIIHTILRNVISNAVKFTPAGRNIYIDFSEKDKRAFISVRDEGNGIPKDVLDKIHHGEFVSSRGTANEKGTGIGLMFSKDLLGKLEGSFTIDTTNEAGTTITISFPSAG